PQRGGRLVPGGAAEHGRLDVCRPAPRAGSHRARCCRRAAAFRRARRGGLAGHRPLQTPCRGAEPARLRRAGRLRAMATEIKVPNLGESITEATVAKWLKQPGEPVAADEPVAELETDKVTLEVPAPAAGTLAEIMAAEGANVPVGAV